MINLQFTIFIDWVVDILSNFFSFLLAVTTSRQRRRWQKYIYIIVKTSDCMQVFTGQFSVQAHIITNQKFHLKLYLWMLAVVKETHVNCLWVGYIYISQTLVVSLFVVCNCVNSWALLFIQRVFMYDRKTSLFLSKILFFLSIFDLWLSCMN